jgi:epoxyqueuosine reductase
VTLPSAKSSTPPNDIAQRIKQLAAELGFAACGICPAVAPPGLDHLDRWLASGFAGQMHWLEERRAAYEHPAGVLPGTRSLIVLAYPYRTAEPQPIEPGQGRVSRYAWGRDYHDLLRKKLHRIADTVRELAPGTQARGVVDTAPLLEGEFARLAGIGWIGKNTLLLNRQWGSWFFLAAVLTDLELPTDEPFAADHCGTCRACLDACPTDAFVEPYVLDARRCISYLTIELQDHIPDELKPGLGDWVFGCDVCQDVCPWNRRAPTSAEPEFAPQADRNPLDLVELLSLSEEQFRARFRGTPLWRAHRRGLLRSAAIVLGNQRFEPAATALTRLLTDPEPLVRAACGWALLQIGTPEARAAVAAHRSTETDPEVLAHWT